MICFVFVYDTNMNGLPTTPAQNLIYHAFSVRLGNQNKQMLGPIIEMLVKYIFTKNITMHCIV